MLDAPAPPFDATDLEPALRPFGRSRMLPRDAYVSQRVLAFELERFFAGSWTCAGREGDLAGTGSQRAVRVGYSFVINLGFLGGADRLGASAVHALLEF